MGRPNHDLPLGNAITIRERVAFCHPVIIRGTRPRGERAQAGLPPGHRRTVAAKLRLEGIPEKLQRAYFVTRNEDVIFTRLEDGPHHDGVRFGNGAEVTLQQLGTGVQGWVCDALSSPLAVRETAEVL